MTDPGITGKMRDFSRPLDLLRASQQCLRAKCEELRRLAARLKERGCDDEARAIATRLIAYFDNAAYCHYEDMQQDLLPRMVAAATMSRGSSLTRLVADVTNEHRAMQRAWICLRAGLQEVIGGHSASLDALAVDHFVKLHQAHITVAHANVFPLAEMLLSREDMAVIGARMAERRGESASWEPGR